jgi:penicillin-binding protein 2
VAGGPLRLTLDLELQRYIHSIFPDSMQGAVVAMVPSTGEVLAIYSNPTFDPNDLARGPSPALWAGLNRDPRKPLLDRAINARYPPASTWKLATAAAAARRGLVRADTRMPIACRGGMAYAGRYARCHERSGHGDVPLSEAIEKSCNVYFYQLGIRLGLEELSRAGTRMGFARRTGIDLPGESAPQFPSGRDWYRANLRSPAVPSDVLSLAIGQGPNSQTVLRMAHFYSALAGDGTARAPHLVVSDSIARNEGAIDLGLDRAGMEALWSGLRRVAEPGGTARAAALAKWRIYGKTGTAQNSQGADHGWFAGFAGAPGGHPEIVMAVIVEHGLHGGDVAPIAAKAMEFHLARRRGIAPDPRPTLAERWETGRMRWDSYDPPSAPLVPRPRSTSAADR